MTTSNQINWTKALEKYTKQHLSLNNNQEFEIESYQMHNDGILVSVDKVEYFTKYEKLAHLSKMESDEYLDFISQNNDNEMREELERFWQCEQAVELFCFSLESHIEREVHLCLSENSIFNEFLEFKTFVFQECIFSIIERVNDFESFPNIDKYSEVEKSHNQRDSFDYQLPFVATSK